MAFLIFENPPLDAFVLIPALSEAIDVVGDVVP
jgi:hypothetical protein